MRRSSTTGDITSAAISLRQRSWRGLPKIASCTSSLELLAGDGAGDMLSEEYNITLQLQHIQQIMMELNNDTQLCSCNCHQPAPLPDVNNKEIVSDNACSVSRRVTVLEGLAKTSAAIGLTLLQKLQEVDQLYQRSLNNNKAVVDQLKHQSEAWSNERARYIQDLANYQSQLVNVDLMALSANQKSLSPMSPRLKITTTATTSETPDIQWMDQTLSNELSELQEKIVELHRNEVKLKADHRKKLMAEQKNVAELLHTVQQQANDLKQSQGMCSQLRSEVTRVTKQLSTTSDALASSSSIEVQQLIGVVIELQSTNLNLRSEIAQLNDLLMEAREEITQFWQDSDRLPNENHGLQLDMPIVEIPLLNELDASPHSILLSSSPRTLDVELLAINKPMENLFTPVNDSTLSTPDDHSLQPLPVSTSSLPPLDAEIAKYQQSISQRAQLNPLVFSEQSLSESKLQLPYHDVIHVLQNLYIHSTSMLQRLNAVDMVALNRKLRCVFDITKLTALSGEMTENILSDLEKLEERCGLDQLTTQLPSNEDTQGQENNNSIASLKQVNIDCISALKGLFAHHQQLLRRVADLQCSLNLYADAYVHHMQEKSRTEEEHIRTRTHYISETSAPGDDSRRPPQINVSNVASKSYLFVNRAIGSVLSFKQRLQTPTNSADDASSEYRQDLNTHDS